MYGARVEDVAWAGGGRHAIALRVRGGAGGGEPSPTAADRSVPCDVLIGADGCNSVLHTACPEFAPVTMRERNTRVYRKLPLRVVEGFRRDLNYSARSVDGVVIEGLPVKGADEIMGVVLIRPEDDSGILGLSSVRDAREYFQEKVRGGGGARAPGARVGARDVRRPGLDGARGAHSRTRARSFPR